MLIKKNLSTDFKNGLAPLTDRSPFIFAMGCITAIALLLAGCGGGDSGSTPPATQNPLPGLSYLTPSSIAKGSRGFTLTVNGSNFLSGSVVRWNSSDRATSYVSSTRLTASILPADLANAGTASVTVFNPSPGGGLSGAKTFTINAVDPLAILTPRLPDAQNTKTYNYTLQGSGGIPPYTWAVAGGSLPGGLQLNASTGTITGTPPVVASDTDVTFSIRLSDDSYVANTLTQSFAIRVHANKLGRNDSCPTATPITNGIFRASISPFGDVDVYSFQGTAGALVTAEIYAQRLDIYNDSTRDVYMDSFLEILDSGCNWLIYNDDITSGQQDSRIQNYSLPYTGTYYIRVSDLRGDGRPDFIYELHLSGAN